MSVLLAAFHEPEVLQRLEEAVGGRKADVVVSDMAPNLSGIETSDAARISHLVELAVEHKVVQGRKMRVDKSGLNTPPLG